MSERPFPVLPIHTIFEEWTEFLYSATGPRDSRHFALWRGLARVEFREHWLHTKGLGKNTVLDRSTHPPAISKLHYEFQGWLGDELVESFPCYLLSTRLKTAVEEAHLSGVNFAPVEVPTSSEFRQLQPATQLPDFVWLQVIGKPGQDDFGFSADFRLVVSESAMDTLSLRHCKVEEYTAE